MMGKTIYRAFLPGLITAVLACNSTVPVTDNSDTKPDEDLRTEHVGTVSLAFADQGCEVIIQMNSKSEHTYLIPIGLDDKYKKDGAVLYFNYRLSRAPQGDCKKGQTAILEDISTSK